MLSWISFDAENKLFTFRAFVWLLSRPRTHCEISHIRHLWLETPLMSKLGPVQASVVFWNLPCSESPLCKLQPCRETFNSKTLRLKTKKCKLLSAIEVLQSFESSKGVFAGIARGYVLRFDMFFFNHCWVLLWRIGEDWGAGIAVAETIAKSLAVFAAFLSDKAGISAALKSVWLCWHMKKLHSSLFELAANFASCR